MVSQGYQITGRDHAPVFCLRDTKGHSLYRSDSSESNLQLRSRIFEYRTPHILNIVRFYSLCCERWWNRSHEPIETRNDDALERLQRSKEDFRFKKDIMLSFAAGKKSAIWIERVFDKSGKAGNIGDFDDAFARGGKCIP